LQVYFLFIGAMFIETDLWTKNFSSHLQHILL
jgi:hypothetical protein